MLWWLAVMTRGNRRAPHKAFVTIKGGLRPPDVSASSGHSRPGLGVAAVPGCSNLFS
jgi:hypothetical protein